MKRIFIAIKIEPGQTLRRIHSTLKSVLGSERINWIDPANMHLTMAFLGDTEEELIKVVSIMLKQECTGFGNFIFKLKGAGVFKNYRDPRVIWIGIENNEKLMKLNEEINIGLKDSGFRLEDRPFNPHITLGRIKSIRNQVAFQSALEKYKDTLIQEIQVEEVILFESILKPTGPVYKITGKFSLK